MEGEREIIYLSLHCHHQDHFCIKMGSNQSHFNVSDYIAIATPSTAEYTQLGGVISINNSVVGNGRTGVDRVAGHVT